MKPYFQVLKKLLCENCLKVKLESRRTGYSVNVGFQIINELFLNKTNNPVKFTELDYLIVLKIYCFVYVVFRF